MLLESPEHPPVCWLEGPEGQITWEIFYMSRLEKVWGGQSHLSFFTITLLQTTVQCSQWCHFAIKSNRIGVEWSGVTSQRTRPPSTS